jgi:ATP synthase protein I
VVDSPAPGDPKDRSQWSEILREAAPYLSIGTSFAASLIVCIGLGYWLDKKLGTSPWLLLAGSSLGVFAGFYQLYKTVASEKK